MKSIVITLLPVRPLRLNYAHFKTLQGLAYRLMGYNEALAAEVHDRRYPDRKVYKFFCFTDLGGRYLNDKKNKKLIYSSSFTWELRSADDRIIDAAERYVLSHRTVEISGQACEIISYETQQKHIRRDTLSVVMNTPVVVYHTEPSGFIRYYHPFEDAFYDAVIKNIGNKYESFYEKPLPCDVMIQCTDPSDRDKCVTHYEESVLTAWYGEYRITASPEALDFIWHTGLGGKNSMGFGTIIEKE